MSEKIRVEGRDKHVVHEREHVAHDRGRVADEDMTVEQYEENIEVTRHEIDRTLQSLEERISPRQVWNRYSSDWGGELRQYSGNLGRSLKNNPVPATLMGISLIWLMTAESNVGARYRSSLQDKSSGGGLREKYAKGKSRAGEAISGASGRMHEMTDSMRERGDQLRSKGQEWSDKLQSSGSQLRSKGQEWSGRLQESGSDLADQPVFMAAAGLVLGSLLALTVPTSRKERELVGGKREELMHKASEVGKKTLREGKEAASAAADTFKREMDSKEQHKDQERPETTQGMGRQEQHRQRQEGAGTFKREMDRKEHRQERPS